MKTIYYSNFDRAAVLVGQKSKKAIARPAVSVAPVSQRLPFNFALDTVSVLFFFVCSSTVQAEGPSAHFEIITLM